MDGALTVGRGPHNDVELASDEVSWSHAVFRNENGNLVVEDLGSRNGTHLNGERLEQLQPLSVGAHVEVGPYRFVLVGSTGESRHRRLHLQDAQTGLRYTVRGGLFLIGDDEDCDLRVENVGTCRISWEDGVVRVDGEQVEAPHELTVGDRTLRLISQDRAYTPTATLPDAERTLLLRVSLSPPKATVVDTSSGATAEVTARTRVDFLYVLATALLEDSGDDVAEELLGWRSDEDVSLAIWGREGLRGSAGRLNTLAYRLRQDFQSVGFSRALIEKRSGWTRLKHDGLAIERV